MTSPVTLRTEHDGAVLRVVLDRPKGNVLDAAMCEALTAVLLDGACRSGPLRCVAIEGAGKHFSFGASVPEHAPGEVDAMLPRFHRLIRALIAFPLPTVALLRGQCLGGGLEVAAACSVLMAEEGTMLGQPEIQLGVFAPAASVLLPARIGQARAEELLLTGRSVAAQDLPALVTSVTPPGELEAFFGGWLARHVLPRSSAALRFATQAARTGLRAAVDAQLQGVEDLYLQGLMQTHDAGEGIASFLERREPEWAHR